MKDNTDKNIHSLEKGDPSPSSSFKSSSEIDEIMKKLEKLEKAQNMLENFMNANEGEGDGDENSNNTSVSSSVIKSKSVTSHDISSYSKPFTPSKSKSLTHQPAVDTDEEISKGLSFDMDSLRKLLDQDALGGGDRESKSRPVSRGHDRSVDELLKEYETLEKEMEKAEGHGSGSNSAAVSARSTSKKSPYESGYGVVAATVQMQIRQLDPVVVPPRASKSQTRLQADVPSNSNTNPRSKAVEKPEGAANARYEERVKPLGRAEKSRSSTELSNKSNSEKGTSAHQPGRDSDVIFHVTKLDTIPKDVPAFSVAKPVPLYTKPSSHSTLSARHDRVSYLIIF